MFMLTMLFGVDRNSNANWSSGNKPISMKRPPQKSVKITMDYIGLFIL